MAKRKRTNKPKMIYKTLHKKLKIEQYEHHPKLFWILWLDIYGISAIDICLKCFTICHQFLNWKKYILTVILTLGLNCIFTKGYSDDHNKHDENELQLHCCSVYSSDYYVNVSLGADFTPKTIGDTHIYMYILQVDAYGLNLKKTTV
jgi:hypothetical protein